MYTPFEKIGIKNVVNKMIGPFVEKLTSELVEMKMSLDREIPNVELCLRRIKNVEKLIHRLEEERSLWNKEL